MSAEGEVKSSSAMMAKVCVKVLRVNTFAYFASDVWFTAKYQGTFEIKL